MERFLKILKIGALLLFIFVLVVLCAPTPKSGAFLMVHFVTTLTPWLLAQALFLALALVSKNASHTPRLRPCLSTAFGLFPDPQPRLRSSSLRC